MRWVEKEIWSTVFLTLNLAGKARLRYKITVSQVPTSQRKCKPGTRPAPEFIRTPQISQEKKKQRKRAIRCPKHKVQGHKCQGQVRIRGMEGY